MTKAVRRPRSDAARNSARILAVAFEAFASEGFCVPVDEIARRAGVGPGTVYRHFPAKEDLFRAVLRQRLQGLAEKADALLAGEVPGKALFGFIRWMVFERGANRDIAEALAGVEIDHGELDDMFVGIMTDLLDAAWKAETLRRDVDIAAVKTLIVGCQAMHGHDATLAIQTTEIVLDGLRAR